MVTARLLFALTVISLASFLPTGGILRAEEPSQAAIDRANAFLGKRSTGDFVLGYAHLGATYTSHEVQSVRYVQDGNGNVLPGKFAIVYRYNCEASGSGVTDIGFICDRKGNVAEVVVVGTNAVSQQPFLVADATIQVLGNLVIEAFKDQMTKADVRVVQQLVNAANSEGLLEFALVIRQTVSR